MEILGINAGSTYATSRRQRKLDELPDTSGSFQR